MISAIVAVDENWGIGFNGELLEKIPEDMEYFKNITIGNKNNTVVMGRKTKESLPIARLPHRKNIVITRNIEDNLDHITYANSGITFMTLEYFLKNKKFIEGTCDNVFIIGGGQIYKELLPFCDRVYVTKIFKEHENVDTYFPNLDEPEEWDTWKAIN